MVSDGAASKGINRAEPRLILRKAAQRLIFPT